MSQKRKIIIQTTITRERNYLGNGFDLNRLSIRCTIVLSEDNTVT